MKKSELHTHMNSGSKAGLPPFFFYPRQLLLCITVYKSKAGTRPKNSEAFWKYLHSFPSSGYKLNVKFISVPKML